MRISTTAFSFSHLPVFAGCQLPGHAKTLLEKKTDPAIQLEYSRTLNVPLSLVA